MKNLRWKIIISILVFIAVIIATIITTRVSEIQNDSTKEMTAATLPTMVMLTEDGIRYNLLHGYVTEIDASGLHDCVTVLPENRKLDIEINNYGNVIKGIRYEIYSLDLSQYIENTEITDFSTNKDITKATLGIKNLLTKGEEYLLKIIVETENGKSAGFYTRIVWEDGLHVSEKLEYVRHFSQVTFDAEAINEIIPKLEPSSKGDNTNFGYVNIHSKLSQIGWGELHPKVISYVYPYLAEIAGNTADIRLDYRISTQAASGTDIYNVNEYFRIRRADETTTYVLSYERYTHQIFDAEDDLNSSGRIYIGIDGGLNDYKLCGDSTGRVTAFNIQGNLWTYNSKTNEFVRVFSFLDDSSKYDDIRESYENHGIKVISCDSSGNVTFVVYGYMNRGAHEGEMGISVCKYDAKETTVTEILYIPRTEITEVIERDVNTLSFLNKDNRYFTYQNGTIYSIDTTTKEYMMVSDNANIDTCEFSEKYSLFAYQEGDDRYRNENINYIYLSTGETGKLTADIGEYIRTLGTIDGNLVFGKTYSWEITTDEDGYTTYPLYRVDIINGDLESVKRYMIENVRITGLEIQEARIIISRVKKGADGEFVAINNDELLSKAEGSYTLRYTDQVATDLREKETYIILSVDVPQTAAKVVKNVKTVFDGGAIIYTQNKVAKVSDFRVYGLGRLVLMTDNLSEAIELANNWAGVVVGSEGQIIWHRYKASKAGVNIREYDEFVPVYDISGVDIDEACLFISEGDILYVKGENTYYMIYAYDASNVTLFDASDTESIEAKTMSKQDISAIIKTYGLVKVYRKK